MADRARISLAICMGAVAYGYASILQILLQWRSADSCTSPSYDTGFFGGTIALASFKSAFGLNSSNSSNTSANLVSLFQAGSFFGAGLQLPMTTRFGRKWSIIISNLIFIVSAIVQTFANGSVGTMMGGEQRRIQQEVATPMLNPISRHRSIPRRTGYRYLVSGYSRILV